MMRQFLFNIMMLGSKLFKSHSIDNRLITLYKWSFYYHSVIFPDKLRLLIITECGKFFNDTVEVFAVFSHALYDYVLSILLHRDYVDAVRLTGKSYILRCKVFSALLPRTFPLLPRYFPPPALSTDEFHILLHRLHPSTLRFLPLSLFLHHRWFHLLSVLH